MQLLVNDGSIKNIAHQKASLDLRPKNADFQFGFGKASLDHKGSSGLINNDMSTEADKLSAHLINSSQGLKQISARNMASL